MPPELPPRRIDPVERAHLRDAAGFSPPIHRYAPSPGLSDLVRRYWMPVWSLEPGVVTHQRVLQYPVCLIVVADSYARLVGPQRGLSVQELRGRGWAMGAMLQPAAGERLAGGPVQTLTDRFVPLDAAAALDGPALEHDVRAAVGDEPDDRDRQAAVVGVFEEHLSRLLPVDDEGLLVNAVVEHVEGDPEVQRVSQLCEKFALGERTLQRLTARRIGLSPKWLIQRRRLHEAAERLRSPEPPDLSRVAVDLGYSDQSHFARDFRTATGLTPGQYAAEPRPR
ncbi:AraC family transcriptional regulator [Nocardioides ferulae]|uniref:AraC family transcriptional regulator n=1 Tax=Nocardioides ferulae TaxID=2340821 RepID=UPI000EAF5A10|nr:AraC family transcriptional regulator [Nocardioides ferulae]